MSNLPFQYELRPVLPEIPNVYGASDYREFRAILSKIDHLLIHCDLEKRLIDQALSQWLASGDGETNPYAERQLAFRNKNLRYALRCNIARHLIGESFRAFSIRLADSSLLQWFTGISGFEHRKAASKSALERYDKYFDVTMFDEEIKHWLSGLLDPTKAAGVGLKDSLSFSSIFMDSTCVKANIHFPVDWVLLRDAARSLLSAIKTIRKQGLKHRMIEPSQLMRNMNKLCIEMSHVRRRKDSQKKRKAILRKMKALSYCIEKHAMRYKTMLEARWRETDLTKAQKEQVISRIDNILNQLPAAIKQAHERIIGERKIPSGDKILSLYEPDVHVIVRGKAGNEVEFGQGLLLREQKDGILVDWKLFQEQPPSDSRLLKESITRIETSYGAIDSACADRSFSSRENERFLKNHQIYDAMCPRNPKQLQSRLKEERFLTLQTRRGQTEARMGVFKNLFLGRPLRSKGFLHKELTVSWCVLTHNLWVIARMAIADEQSALEQAA